MQVNRYTNLVLTIIAGCGLGACFVVSSGAQESSSPHAPLMETLGDYHRPVSTSAPLAQRFFDQGLRLIFGYYFPEAVVSFREAVRHDANFAMAYWGMALAIGPNPNSRYFSAEDDPKGEGRKAIEIAVSLGHGASERERAYIEALAIRFSDREESDREYAEAMRRLLERYPSDPDAGMLYADALMTMSPWTYWGADGKPYFSGTLEAATALEHVIEKLPQHPGANHLYIHLMENSQTPERALPHADRLAQLMPGLGHVVHMPGHIYLRTGRYEKAILTNRASVVADQEMASIWKGYEVPMDVPSSGLSHVVHPRHALAFIHFAAGMQGRYELALEVAREFTSRVSVTPWLTMRRFGKWQEILEISPPPEANPFVQGMWSFVRGDALAATGETRQAQRELDQVLANVDAASGVPVGVNSGPDLLLLAAEALAGQIAFHDGHLEESIRHLETAVRMEDGLNYIEPPAWGSPMRQWLGAALLESGRAREAEAVYWEDLRRNPDNGWSLFGLQQSLRAQGKVQSAARVEKRFRRAWARADVELKSSRF